MIIKLCQVLSKLCHQPIIVYIPEHEVCFPLNKICEIDVYFQTILEMSSVILFFWLTMLLLVALDLLNIWCLIFSFLVIIIFIDVATSS